MTLNQSRMCRLGGHRRIGGTKVLAIPSGEASESFAPSTGVGKSARETAAVSFAHPADEARWVLASSWRAALRTSG